MHVPCATSMEANAVIREDHIRQRIWHDLGRARRTSVSSPGTSRQCSWCVSVLSSLIGRTICDSRPMRYCEDTRHLNQAPAASPAAGKSGESPPSPRLRRMRRAASQVGMAWRAWSSLHHGVCTVVTCSVTGVFGSTCKNRPCGV